MRNRVGIARCALPIEIGAARAYAKIAGSFGAGVVGGEKKIESFVKLDFTRRES